MARNEIRAGVLMLAAASLLLFACAAGGCASPKPAAVRWPIELADPTIFAENGTYYLYGTREQGDSDGIPVYSSRDLFTWKSSARSGGFALKKGDVFGTAGFWAPQVFKFGGRYFMAYAANEQVALAESDSPLGPFRQRTPRPLGADDGSFSIDPFVFFDGGTPYLYYVRGDGGNTICVVQMTPDLSGVLPATRRTCLRAQLPWENTAHSSWPVAEGPTVFRQGADYYLFYSANDYRSADYSVGCAESASPLGPWRKQAEPLLSRKNLPASGTGHGDLFRGPDGALDYVFHTHFSASKVQPRKTALIRLKLAGSGSAPGTFSADANSFRYLWQTP